MLPSERDEREAAVILTIAAPKNNQRITGRGPDITVSGTVTGVRGEAVHEVSVRIGDRGDWSRADGTTEWTFTGPVPHNGLVRVYARATDRSGVVADNSVSVQCELTNVPGPKVTITAPASGFTVTGDGQTVGIAVTADVADDLNGLAAVSWLVDGISLAHEAFATPVRTWQGTRTLRAPAGPRTEVAVVVAALDAAGNHAERTATVRVNDVTAPFLTVDVPAQNARIPAGAMSGGITVQGTASDLESGVASVEVALDGGAFQPATLTGFAPIEWARAVPAVAPGRHTVTVRSTDSAGNTRAVTASFEVAQPYQRRDALDLFSQGSYLQDLLWFATTHLADQAGQPLTVERLSRVFSQPFASLADPQLASASTPVNEVRPTIEVLRRFLSSPDSGLVTHLRLNEGSGTTTADTSGAATATLAGPTWTEGRTGSAALLFDGVNDAVTLTASQRVRDLRNAFTIAFWALPLSPRQSVPESASGASGTSGQRYAFGPEQGGIAYGSPDHAGVGISVGTNGVSVFEHSDYYLPALLVHDVPITGWTHIAVTYQWEPADFIFGTPAGWRPTLHLNGVFVKAGVMTSKSAVHCVPADIGASAQGYGAFHGRLDDIRIYDRVLFTGQIAILAQEREHAAVRQYAAQTYRRMLTAVGTSYQELRLIRGADPAARTALAERLGFDLDPARPDQLDGLLLGPDEPSEAFLQDTFGLLDTTGDPLRTPPPPRLLTWRRQRQRRLWHRADHPQPEPVPPAPLIIDPDLLQPADLRNQAAGDRAFDLLAARRAWVGAQFAAIRTSREGLPAATTALDAFDTVVGEVLGVPASRLAELATARGQGVDIEPELGGLHLGPAEFTQLLRARELAGTGLVTADEWTELYHLLTQVRKAQQHGSWRQAEAALSLTPEHFVVSIAAWQPIPWRAYLADRVGWQQRLQARIDQEAAAANALAEAVEEVERQSLTQLRDGLLATVGTTSRELEAERLTELLFVDFSSGGTQPATRIGQAIEVIQQLVLGLRTGQLPPWHPARGWQIEPGSVASFDEEWTWMGAYDAWRAAIFVFNFPEDLLAPTLRDPDSMTPSFMLFLDVVRGLPRMRSDVARTAAQDYLNGIRTLLENFPVTVIPPAGHHLRDQLLTYRLTDQLTPADLAARLVLTQGCLVHLSATHSTLPNYLQELFYYVPMVLAQALQKAGDYVGALDWYRTVYAYHLSDLPDFLFPVDERKIYYGLGMEYNGIPNLSRGTHWLRDQLNPHTVAAGRPNPYTRYTFAAIARCMLEYGDSEFTRDTGESRARARSLYLAARTLLRSPELATVPTWNAPGLTSPVLVALNAKVDNQLRKLRQGRNVTGMKRQIEVGTNPDIAAGAPTVDASGQLVVPALVPMRPTPYRFTVLVERCRQLATTAAQMEASYLSALEKRDANAYDRLKAGFDLDIARAGQQLQTLRVTEAQAGTEQARRQRAVEDVRRGTYQKWIDDGPNRWERSLVDNFNQAREYRDWMGGMDAVITTASAVASVMSWWGAAAAAAVGTAATARAILGTQLNKTEQDIQLNTLRASQARRQDEWQLQVALAIQDGLVAEQGIQIALDHEAVVAQESRIADLQAFQSQTVADFLARKFTNTELYEWMSDVLGGVYAHFLQQATGVAQLAQSQLAFERQQVPPAFVQADYWRAPQDLAAPSSTTRAPDRRGLTGSARLLQDIQRLEQFAFEQDRRKLNLTQTFSLAQLAPFDFERFRETGVLPFATPMELFDRSFPGHYLRLIKRVRTSLVALVPPTQGIRATLAVSGVSRVVTGPEVFSEVIIRRDPELVALTSAINASGVFDLDPQAEMLLPFESMGVATSWEFQLPKPANQFDYRTIADLLLTVEYTALSSSDYRQQVVQRLDPRLGGERLYRFRDHFPDAWYELNNPEQSSTPMTVTWQTRRGDFPPNVDDTSLRVDQLLLYVRQAQGSEEQILVDRFTLQPASGGPALPATSSTARSTDTGLISTRAGNWNWLSGMAGPVPVTGTWTLTFAADTAQRFTGGEIEDILFAITYSGRSPGWPEM